MSYFFSSSSGTFKARPVITVDNIKVAQFIYLLLNNQEIRDVIQTITSKAVLILGRFSDERKPISMLSGMSFASMNYLPIMFDFTRATNQPTLDTIKTLASMARFVIADLTDTRSVLLELGAIVPQFPFSKSSPRSKGWSLAHFFPKGLDLLHPGSYPTGPVSQTAALTSLV